MKDIKFAVFTDLHADFIPDGVERVRRMVAELKTHDLDFIINLGDLCRPIDSNREVLRILAGLDSDCYHLIGNHDTDRHSKEHILEFYSQPKAYYSFVRGDCKFIALDTCFFEEEGVYQPYQRRIHKGYKGHYPVLPPDQLKWLASEFGDQHSKYIIFSHHSLENNFKKRGVHNRLEIQKIISDAEAQGKHVILCINGHDHADSMQIVGKTYYFTVNSMAYIWLGDIVKDHPSLEGYYKQYPLLKDVLLYDEGLFAVITLKDNGEIIVDGKIGKYRTYSPEELGLNGNWNGRKLSSDVTSGRYEDLWSDNSSKRSINRNYKGTLENLQSERSIISRDLQENIS